jgi:hypothetical protein
MQEATAKRKLEVFRGSMVRKWGSNYELRPEYKQALDAVARGHAPIRVLTEHGVAVG